LLDATPRTDWARTPGAGVSTIGWQVGHLATAAYRLALERIRGRLPEDDALIAQSFVARFGRDSVPDAVPVSEAELQGLLDVYERVHGRIQAELPSVAEDSLDVPIDRPHLVCKTRRDCLAWCAQHELVHAGQVGLLRRQLGHAPVW